MTSNYTRISAIAALAICLAACERSPGVQNQAQDAEETGQTLAIIQAPEAEPAPPQIPPATELPVTSVNSVTLSWPDDTPGALVIHAAGTAASLGWTDPKLAEMPDDQGDGSVRTFQFVATSPDIPEEKRASQPIEAELMIEAMPGSVKRVRILSGTNEVSAPVVH